MKNLVFICCCIFLLVNESCAQITLGFQGAEPSDPWTYTSTGADNTAQNQANLTPNKVTGTASIVVGGNTAGGSCIDGGSGNGPDALRNITFSSLDISNSSNQTRTLVFNWGTRFPTCVGTGWDANEDLIFTPYHNGVAQAPITVQLGNNNAVFNIATHQFTYTIPSCVNTFYFELGITTNRRDELLFVDNVKLTTPSLNAPMPTLSSISGTSTVCTGNSQTLSVTPLSNTTLTWSGLPTGATFTSVNGTTSSSNMGIDWGTATAGTYTISVTPSQIICGSPTSGNPATIQITVSALPLVASGTATICAGQTAQISASGATSYNWNQGLGAGNTFTVSPTSSTVYQVTGTSGNCTGVASVTVTVSNALNVSGTASPTAICVGGSSILTASGADSYVWQAAASLSATNTATVTATPSVTTTYSVIGTSGNCTATATITVSVTSATAVTIVPSNTNVCVGSPVTLTANGATTYAWQPAATLNSTTGSVVVASPISNTTYTVTGTTANCSSTATVAITVTPINISVVSSNDTICAGTAVTLTASGGNSYTWLPANGLSATTGATVSANPMATTQYTVTGSINSCQSNATVTVFVENQQVNAGANQTVCAGNPVVLSATGATNCTWNNGVTNGISFVPQTTQLYTVSGTTPNGCLSTDDILITIEAALLVDFSADKVIGCAPLNVQFSNVALGVNTFQWNFGDGTFSTDQNPLHTFIGAGCKDISLTIQSANGCTASFTLPNYICPSAAPTASFFINPQEVSESNPLATFNNTSENANSWFWNFGDQSTSNQKSPSHTFTGGQDTYSITLIAYNAAGCVDSATVLLPYSVSPIYYVPNAFTPDGNELNQTFQPVFTAGFDPMRYNLQIFDRWGQRIFESSDPKLGWDGTYNGTMVQDGIYVWKIGFNPKDTDDKIILDGHVTLLR